MKAMLIPVVLGVSLVAGLGARPADAAGCIKGAVVGSLAGHMVHHGVLGALTGCAIGHHEAAKSARQSQEPGNGTVNPETGRSTSHHS